MAAHRGGVKLLDLLATLANCDKTRSVGIHDRCMARFEKHRNAVSPVRTMLERRRKVMADWAAFLAGESDEAKAVEAKVVPIESKPRLASATQVGSA